MPAGSTTAITATTTINNNNNNTDQSRHPRRLQPVWMKRSLVTSGKDNNNHAATTPIKRSHSMDEVTASSNGMAKTASTTPTTTSSRCTPLRSSSSDGLTTGASVVRRRTRKDSRNHNKDTLSAPTIPYDWIPGWITVNDNGTVMVNKEDQTVTVQLEKEASFSSTTTSEHSNPSNNSTGLGESSPSTMTTILRVSKDRLEKDILMGNTYNDNTTDNNEGGTTSIPSDLCTLTHFHEPAIVSCLERRYQQGFIYTSTGPVLLAVNPFSQHVQDVYYTADQRAAYWSKAEDPAAYARVVLEPHVYQMADDAFRGMMRALLAMNQSNTTTKTNKTQNSTTAVSDQSILVSGESGAGKTVTTKHVMQYLAALSQRTVQTAKTAVRAYEQVHHQKVSTNSSRSSQPSPAVATTKKASSPLLGTSSHSTTPPPATVAMSSSPSSSSCIETQVLQSNPILESFGNARTLRNDNSSRFGKCIDLQFTAAGRLIGTCIETYLLEKVRVVHQTAGERNYHIFYELLAAGALTTEQVQAMGLTDPKSGNLYKPSDFTLLSGSGTYTRRDGVSDKDTFRHLSKAMRLIGFAEEEQESVLATTAALLHASNIRFTATPNNGHEEETCQIDTTANSTHLDTACRLLGVSHEAIQEALCAYTITVQGNQIRKPQTLDASQKGLDALLKSTYAALFTYLVQRINESIQSNDATVESTIGVLDIFGFESFAVNSFEQLCINYCNEVLQQQFNTFMLKNEQATYASEGIDWDYITFPENQDVLDLLDDRKDGIISILDDMCRAPNASDKGFSTEIVKRCGSNSRFRTEYKDSAPFFTIQHYAGSVEYATENFVEKNRDDLPRETNILLLGSSVPFVHKLAQIIQAGANSDVSSTSGSKKSRPSVGGHFLKQVKELRTKIDHTCPHYIRCIKPNALLAPNYFDRTMVANQLQCGGVLQAVGVTRNGFTLHYTHIEFMKRYMCLIPLAVYNDAKKKGVEVMVNSLLKEIVAHEKKTADKVVTTNKKETSQKIDNKKAADGEPLTIGKSKVLLKHHAFESLEELLGVVQNEKATRINAIFRRFLCRVAYQEVRSCFHQELQKMGQTFDEWFKEYREIYYKPREKNLGYNAIPNIVKLRQQQFQKATSQRTAVDRKKKPTQISLQNSAWILEEGLWTRNPNYNDEAPAGNAKDSAANRNAVIGTQKNTVVLF
uniref:Myosin motor domain-containing protein n=1 Tax=Amphora coffeiformis TaxID=265554 RepID=A0A6S8L6F1_9STRA